MVYKLGVDWMFIDVLFMVVSLVSVMGLMVVDIVDIFSIIGIFILVFVL